MGPCELGLPCRSWARRSIGWAGSGAAAVTQLLTRAVCSGLIPLRTSLQPTTRAPLPSTRPCPPWTSQVGCVAPAPRCAGAPACAVPKFQPTDASWAATSARAFGRNCTAVEPPDFHISSFFYVSARRARLRLQHPRVRRLAPARHVSDRRAWPAGSACGIYALPLCTRPRCMLVASFGPSPCLGACTPTY